MSSGGKPNILLVTEASAPPVYTVFLRYANVFHVTLDAVLSLPDRLRRFILRRAVRYLPISVAERAARLIRKKLRLYFVNPESLDLVILVEPRFPISRVSRDAVHIIWSHDSHYEIQYKLHLALYEALGYDRLYAVHGSVVKRFREDGVAAERLPYGVITDVFYPRGGPLDPKPVFIGSPTPERKRVIEATNKLLEERRLPRIEWVRAYLHTYAELVSRHLLALNITRAGELNWRVFEVTGARGLLVTSRSPEIEEFFRRDEHILVWSSVEELADRIEEALSDIERSTRMARSACRLAWSEHTMDHRVCTILRAEGFPCDPRPPYLDLVKRECGS